MPEGKVRKGVFGQTGAPTGSLIKTASQAVSILPVGGRRLGEVVLPPKGRQLGEERIGGKELNRGRNLPCMSTPPGYDMPVETPIPNLFNVSDTEKEPGWTGFPACAKNARKVADMVRKRFPSQVRA